MTTPPRTVSCRTAPAAQSPGAKAFRRTFGRRAVPVGGPPLLSRLVLLCLGLLLFTGPARAVLPADELGDLRTALRDSNKFVRKDAVEDLAERAEPEAWSLLVDALEDEAGEVADTAAHLLGGLPLELPEAQGKAFRELYEDLLGKRGLGAKDEGVRRYAAELLGRLAPPLEPRGSRALGKALAKALRDRDPVVRRLAAHACQRLAERRGAVDALGEGLLPGLESAFRKDKDDLVRARALQALFAWGSAEAPAALARALEDGVPLRAAAAVHLGRAPTEAALAPLGVLVGDDAVAVRTAAARALARMALEAESGALRRAALGPLVERLEAEDRPALAARLLADLRRLSGRKHGRDVRPWRDWLGTLGDDWRPVEVEEDDGRARPAAAGERSATLVGLPIRSDAVAFVIDFSGSTWREGDDERTVKEVLDERLREALEALPEDTRFLLVPFTGTPHPWRDELVEASPRNVSAALSWFEDARFQGTGNAWDALVLAQDTPGVDTIVLLSDGAPSGGARYRLESIATLFAERNLGRQVILDCVLVDASRKLQRFWAGIARASGGQVLAVEL